jgi:hypothetical protein
LKGGDRAGLFQRRRPDAAQLGDDADGQPRSDEIVFLRNALVPGAFLPDVVFRNL